MLSLIEVTCPHCAAQGRIMLPPLGAIIIGPCPECQGIVAVFCGKVLPLDKETMVAGSPEEKRDHLDTVLGGFLRERIDRLFADEDSESGVEFEEVDAEFGEDLEPIDDLASDPPGANQFAPISPAELESFKKIDLRLLDNSDYFKAVFDSN